MEVSKRRVRSSDMIRVIKRSLCIAALKIMIKEKDRIRLTSKQKSQVEGLLVKANRI